MHWDQAPLPLQRLNNPKKGNEKVKGKNAAKVSGPTRGTLPLFPAWKKPVPIKKEVEKDAPIKQEAEMKVKTEASSPLSPGQRR